MFGHILMVCTGNICRSPIAQYLLQAQIKAQHTKVRSAGLKALEGHPADPQAVILMKHRGFDLSTHRGKQLTHRMLQEVPLILVMETTQRLALEATAPWTRGKIYTLGYWEAFEIPDPYRKPPSVFETVTALIERGVAQWAQKLI
jgi:protein-tyrosine phosphatase